MKRLNVIYIPKPGDEPYWDETIVSTIQERHQVRTLDPHQPVAGQFSEVDAVVQMGAEKMPGEWVAAARGAGLWQLMSVGYDKFDVAELKKAGIPLCNCPGTTTSPAMAESAMLLMLLIVKKYHVAQRELSAGRAHSPMGDELADRLLGLIGFGASGRATARLAKVAGMRIAIAEPCEIEPAALEQVEPEFVVKPGEMHRLFAEADFVSLHLPLTAETQGSITAELIGRMKSTACLINTARGDLVDQDALYAALLEGRIGGIGTDVHAGVLPDPGHPVYQHPDFYAMPHVAGTSTGTARRRAVVALENLDRLAAGETVQYRIDR